MSILRSLLEQLMKNPILLIFVFGALASFVGQIVKAIKADAERRSREARGGRMPAPPEEPAPQRRDAEDIAREIRRMMQQGLEERAEQQAERRPKASAERQRTRRIEVRNFEQQVAEAAAHVETARVPAAPALPPLPPLPALEGLGTTASAAAARPRPKVFMIKNLRSAIIASEVLGPPVSMRE